MVVILANGLGFVVTELCLLDLVAWTAGSDCDRDDLVVVGGGGGGGVDVVLPRFAVGLTGVFFTTPLLVSGFVRTSASLDLLRTRAMLGVKRL